MGMDAGSGKSLNDFIWTADAKKHGPGPEADGDVWDSCMNRTLIRSIMRMNAFKEERSLNPAVQDAELREERENQAQEVDEAEEEDRRL